MHKILASLIALAFALTATASIAASHNSPQTLPKADKSTPAASPETATKMERKAKPKKMKKGKTAAETSQAPNKPQ